MIKCSVPGCEAEVSREGHTLCSKHYKQKIHGDNLVGARELTEKFNLKRPDQINRALSNLGWIERSGKNGWQPTAQGLRLFAKLDRYRGNDFVLWPVDISKSRILRRAVEELIAIEETEAPAMAKEAEIETAYKPEGFREKYPAKKRTNDGHMVRSRAETLIDNWLYEQRIAHAYEQMVPVEETLYCDFYLPGIDVYIEFWGMENNPKYSERKRDKLKLYKDNNLRLIEIRDKHIDNLDDHLRQELKKF